MRHYKCATHHDGAVLPTSSHILNSSFFHYPSGLCISFMVLKEWQTADGMEEGGVCECVCALRCVCVSAAER